MRVLCFIGTPSWLKRAAEESKSSLDRAFADAAKLSLPEGAAAGRMKQDSKSKRPWRTGAEYIQRLTRTFLGTAASEKSQVRYILTGWSICSIILIFLRVKSSCLILPSAMKSSQQESPGVSLL